VRADDRAKGALHRDPTSTDIPHAEMHTHTIAGAAHVHDSSYFCALIEAQKKNLRTLVAQSFSIA
jgi:hypothetical protein